MPIVIISDLHWGVRSNNTFFLDQQEQFFYNFFFPYLEENGINIVWILGDFFENRKLLSIQVMNRSHRFLEEFERRGIQVYCLLGNHDIVFKNTNEITSLIPTMAAFKNIHLIREFEVHTFDGVPIGFISWISPENKERCLKWISEVETDILCGHFEINNFEIIKGVICNNGLDTKIFDRFSRVFSGHFHIKATDGIIQYVGNPYQTNWGEYGYEKGFHLYDPKTNDLEFVRNPVDIFDCIHYSEALDIINLDPFLYQNKIVRIFSNQGKFHDKKRLELLTELLSTVCHSVDVIETQEVIVDDSNILQISDTSQLIQDYLDSCKVEHVDPKLLSSIVFDVYKEALEKVSVSC
jgi:DNA repair exonuclease SbcCD nuclease subunit